MWIVGILIPTLSFILHTIPTRQYTFEANDYRVSSQKKNPHWKTQRKKKETQRSHSVWGCWQIVWQFVCAIMFINSACCCLSLASGIKDQAPSPRISVLRKTCETKTQDIPSTITHTHTHTHIAAQKSWILSLVSRLSQVMSATQICGGVGGLGGLVEWGNVAWPLTRCQLKC